MDQLTTIATHFSGVVGSFNILLGPPPPLPPSLGTVDYLAPEILDCPVKHHPADHKANPAKWYTNKVDVWSVGILAYELLVGATPFEAVRGWS